MRCISHRKGPDDISPGLYCSPAWPGLLTYYPELVVKLPDTVRSCDKIELYKKEGMDETFGANNLSLHEITVTVADQYERVAAEYKKRGIEVIEVPLDLCVEYGSGACCLTGVLGWDHS